MIKKYRVEKSGINIWSIYEITTEQYVMHFDQAVKAQTYCNNLNKNKVGFNGWTPAFIAEGVCKSMH